MATIDTDNRTTTVSADGRRKTVAGRSAGSGAKSKGGKMADSLLLMSLSNFYANKNEMERVAPIIQCKSKISLRLLDWFVTNYAKKKNVYISKALPDGSTSFFNVYLNYRCQLKAYSKQHFDPFRRRDRIEYVYEKDKSVQTTIGQLNFFRWVLQNDVLDYIAEHATDIESDMMKNKTKSKKNKQRNRPSSSSASSSSSVSSCSHSDQEEEEADDLAASPPRQPPSSATEADASSAISHITGTHVVRFD